MTDGTRVTDEECHVQGILADPENDLLRLIYADWLTENGQADRGEFVRVQCRIARIEDAIAADLESPVVPMLDELAPLRARERELKSPEDVTWHIRWQGNLGKGHMHYPKQSFSRGFVEAITLSAADWFAHADAILAGNPVQEVTFTTMPPFFYQSADDGRWVTTDQGWGNEGHAVIVGRIISRCRYRWQTVKVWHLPPERTDYRNYVDEYAEISPELLRAAPAMYRRLTTPNPPRLADLTRRES